MIRCSPQLQSRVTAYLEERFGLAADHFAPFQFYAGPEGRIFLGPIRMPSAVRPVSIGILIARAGNTVKPSTNLLQMRGRLVIRNTIFLTREQTRAYLRGEDLTLQPDQRSQATDGYVLVKYLDFPLGCGLLKGAGLKNMLPKAKRMEVTFF